MYQRIKSNCTHLFSSYFSLVAKCLKCPPNTFEVNVHNENITHALSASNLLCLIRGCGGKKQVRHKIKPHHQDLLSAFTNNFDSSTE